MDGQNSLERLQSVMTMLMERQLVESLERVEAAITSWRRDGKVFLAHAEILKHAAKAEYLAERMARVAMDNAGSLLRDAFDYGIIDRDAFVSFTGLEPELVEPSPPLAELVTIKAPDKRELVEQLLSKGPILVHIDARNELAEVPPQFKEDPKLVLRFGYGLMPSIIDLSVDDTGICGTLTFGGVPFRCVLPWPVIYSVASEVDHKGMVWTEDVPLSVVDLGDSSVRDATGKPNAPGVQSKTRDKANGDVPPSPPRSKRPGSHLTLVK